MNSDTLDNIKMIAETARDFAEKNIRPHIMEWDESQTFPKELFHQLAKWVSWEL
jgi:alkylation response protein AidB-like acyl-CoA dehydrogenase